MTTEAMVDDFRCFGIKTYRRLHGVCFRLQFLPSPYILFFDNALHCFTYNYFDEPLHQLNGSLV
jgi:hypothetical protein